MQEISQAPVLLLRAEIKKLTSAWPMSVSKSRLQFVSLLVLGFVVWAFTSGLNVLVPRLLKMRGILGHISLILVRNCAGNCL